MRRDQDFCWMSFWRPAATVIFVLLLLQTTLPVLAQEDPSVLIQRAIQLEVQDGDLETAISLYRRVVDANIDDHELIARALLRMANCQQKMGATQEARLGFGRLVAAYGTMPHLSPITEKAREAFLALSPLPEESQLVARKIWDASLFQSAPSADGRYLYTIDEAADLIRVELATGAIHQITSEKPGPRWRGWAWAPTPSPDDRRVAYVWWNENFDWQLRVIDVDGTDMRVLIPDGGTPYAWTAEGEGVIAQILSQPGTTDSLPIQKLVELSAEDGSVRRVIVDNSSGYDWGSDLSITDDGRYGASSHEGDILLFDMETGQVNQLTNHLAEDWGPVWTPDGSRLLFYSMRSGQADLLALDIVEGKAVGLPRLIKSGTGFGRPLGVTRDGTLFYGSAGGMTQVVSVTLDPATLQLAGVVTPVSQRSGSSWKPTFSPDGDHLAYLSRNSETASVIVVRNLHTGVEDEIAAPELLAKGGGLGRWPEIRWVATSNGESRLLVSGTLRAFLLDPNGGPLELVLEVAEPIKGRGVGASRESLATYGLLPDGETLIYARTYVVGETWHRSIRRRNLETGEDLEIYRPLDEHSFARHYAVEISPDGRYLAISEARGHDDDTTFALLLVSTREGEVRELLEGSWFWADNNARPFAWAPNGKELIVAGQGPPSGGVGEATTFWAVSVDDGKRRQLETLPVGADQLRIHPRGTLVSFETGMGSQEIWVLENLLPKADDR